MFQRFKGMLGEVIGKVDPPSAEARKVLAAAEPLAAKRRFAEAIEYATAENRRLRDPLLERRLARWRQEAAVASPATAPCPDWPPHIADPFPDAEGPPEIRGIEALTPERLGGGILHHGCLIVRGLLSVDVVDELKAGIDSALSACEQTKRGHATLQTRTWYSRIPLTGRRESANGRTFAELGNSVFTADSPRMLFNVIELIKAKGIDRVIGSYLGERPVLSIGKSTLRRVPPQVRPGDWHQDGAFLGAATRTVDMWLSLSHCGDDAPGLDMVPRRLGDIVETGTHGAEFDWSVGHSVAEAAAKGRPIASPIFGPGDAVFFDQLFLHRTAGRAGLQRERYAIETWFFAPSTFPATREALLL
jgi:hypothetical protein